MSGRATLPEKLGLPMFAIALAAAIVVTIASRTVVFGDDGAKATVRVHVDDSLGLIRPQVFGHFTELTLTSVEGTVWSEMLFNRKFGQEDPSDQLTEIRTGTGSGWEPLGTDTNITLHLDTQVYYSAPCSQRMTLSSGGSGPAGIRQRGFQPVLRHLSPQRRTSSPFHFKAGTRYRIRLAVKRGDFAGRISIALGQDPSHAVAVHSIEPEGDDWQVHECILTPSADAPKGALMVFVESPGTVWIDSVSLCEESVTEQGFRKDVLEATKRISPTIIRWPGGCFADDYHWKDGIGPVDARPDVMNRAWKSPTDNDVGIDEFVTLCRLVGAEPYICVNYGTGSPEEAAELVEYCNGGAETRWGKVRADNGHPEPYGIRYWNIGNELYLPTEIGATNGREYGKGFKRFAQAMRAVDKDIQLVAVGCFDLHPLVATILRFDQKLWPIVRYHVGWTAGLLQEAGEDIDLLAIHYYEPDDVKDAESLEQVNGMCLATADELNAKLDELLKTIEKHAPAGKHIPIALDEWATWANGGPQPPRRTDIPPGFEIPRDLGLLGAGETLRTALAEAGVMNLMQRRPNDFAVGCKTLLYAYAVGEIGVRRDAVVASPCALMMGLYATHDTCQAIRTEVECERFQFTTLRPRPGSPARRDAPYLDVSARVHSDRRTVDVFVVNRHLTDALPCRLECPGGTLASDIEIKTLTSDDIFDWNTFDQPDTVSVQKDRIPGHGDAMNFTFPPRSIVRLTFQIGD